MRIKSSYKDYYDHIAHIYGGGDPRVVYARDKITNTKIDNATVNDYPLRYLSIKNTALEGTEFRWCIVAGKYYLLVKNETADFHLFTKEKHPILFSYLCTNEKKWFRYPENEKYSEFVGKEDDNLLELSRTVGAPVFSVILQERQQYHKYDVTVSADIPNLSKLGFASLIPPEQMYQDIAYFIGNKINKNPDIEPPAKVSDKDRIKQYGFDLKTSFRHPVK